MYEWKKRKNETPEQYEAFKYFLCTKPKRSVMAAWKRYAEELGIKYNNNSANKHWYEWKKANAWEKRAEKFDEHIFDLAIKNIAYEYSELAVRALSGLTKLLDVYEYTETTTTNKIGANGKETKVYEKKANKFVMPNANAIIFVLQALDKEHFSSEKETDKPGNISELPLKLTEDDGNDDTEEKSK